MRWRDLVMVESAQINIGTFGDTGLQLQNSSISEFLNDHISSQGNDNITDSTVGSGNVIINSGSTCPAGGCH